MAVNWSLNQVLTQLDSGRKWSSGTVSYSFPSTSGGIFSQGEAAGFRPVNAEQQALMVLAMATWDELIPQGFAPGSVGSTNIEFGYTSTSIGYAHAYFPTNGSVWFNVGESSLVNTAVGQYGFQTFIHEIGHALGLNHMGNYNGDGNWSPSSYQDSVVLSIMSYFGPRYAAPNYSAEVMQADWVWTDSRTYSPQTPMVNDVLAIQSMYGTSSTTRTDNTVYGFSSTVGGATAQLYDFTRNRTPILTIFDSGGIDTLNLSGWSSPSRISLVAGSFSSANEMTNNIAIAYSTTIENAEGGSGNDHITGNDVANRLVGNNGNDELYGMGGDDTLIGGFGDDVIDGGAGTDTAIFAGTFASYTITITGSTVLISSATLGNDRVSGVENFQFADVLRTLAELSPGADSNPPALVSRSPADDAGGIATGVNLVLTFSEAVKAGRGEITIFNADGSVFRRIDAGDTSQVQFAGSTVTINPAADLVAGRGYYVQIAAGAITDLANNSFAGIAGTTAWNFTTGASDTGAPQLLRLTPADEATNIAPGANLVLQFDEQVIAGNGFYTIRVGGQVVRTISAGDTTQVSISGGTVTLDPAADLPGGVVVTVTADAGVVRDVAGNAYGGLASQTAWNFTTASAAGTGDDFPYTTDTPGIVAVNGAAITGRIEVGGDQDLFRVSLVAGVVYTFELQRSASGGLADPYLALFNPQLTLVGEDDDSGGGGNSRLGYTAPATGTYYLAVLNYDAVGTGAYTIAARTQDAQAPTLVSRSPADDATQVPVGNDLVMIFSEPVVRGTGTIRLLDANGAVLRELRADDAGVRINGTTVNIDPGANLPPGVAIAVNVDPGVFRDAAGNNFAGISGLSAWNFTTAAVVAAADDYPLSVNTTGVVIVNGSALAARIDSPNDGDLFRVALQAGVTYRFDLVAPQSSAVDPYLALYGALPNVELIGYDDDSGPLPFDSRLFFTPTTAGTYYLAAWDYAEATGVYSIAAVTTPDDYAGSNRGVLFVGGSGSTGTIDAPTDHDSFAVTLTAGVQYTFYLDSEGLEDPYLTLLDNNGNQLAIDDDSGEGLDSQLTYTPSAGGTYVLSASDFDLGTGAYRLSGLVRNVVNGTAGNDNLVGTSGPDTLVGGAGNDRLQGSTGNDILQGGDGHDTAVFAGRTGNFALGSEVGNAWYVNDLVGTQGRDLLYGVERLVFDDGPWAIDVQGSAGYAAKLLGIVFGANAVNDENLVGIALHFLDLGIGQATLMQAALEARLGPSPTNTAVVNLLWTNLFGVGAPAAELQAFAGLIANGTFTQSSLAMAAAEVEINLANIDWESIEQFGLPYQPVG